MRFSVEAGGFGFGVSVGFAGVFAGFGAGVGFVSVGGCVLSFGVGEGCGWVFAGAVVPFGVGKGLAVVLVFVFVICGTRIYPSKPGINWLPLASPGIV